ncbi:MAG: iron-sulfur cluster carrier protein ApbC, partial [Halothiobacillus sp.]|nr:iron-sulfur cluster carrier protein ApbC [Halothiobacillus sp.]
GEKLAAENHVALLGQLPLDLAIRTDVDEGLPTVVRSPDSPNALIYRQTARKLAAALGRHLRQDQFDGPNITIDEDGGDADG